MSNSDSREERINEVLAEYMRRVDSGEDVDQLRFVDEHPDVADELRSYFAMSQVVHKMAGPMVGESIGEWVPAARRGTVAPSRSNDQTVSVYRGGQTPERFGRYRIERVLGQGAMGEVYLAVDTVLERRVALKMPKVSGEDDVDLLNRFEQEAKAAATLSHPGICQIYDVGEVDGCRFIAMAYVEGHPLSQYVSEGKPQPQDRIATIVRRLAIALEHAHQKGIVHRDLKPSNVMLPPKGGPVIMDFGLARRSHSGDVRLTQSGMLLGTPAYMSPEQVDDAATIGPASDIYSLGVILFELLTGRLPFTGTVAGVAGQILTKDPPHPSEFREDVDPRLEELCLTMMRKSPEDRPLSMQEVADRLSEVSKTPAPPRGETAAKPQAGLADELMASPETSKSVLASAGTLSVPVLQQKLQSLKKKGRHRQAIEGLEKVARRKDAQSEEIQTWIRKQLELVKQDRKQIAGQVKSAVEAAQDMLRRHDYGTAVAMLQEVPDELRTDELRVLLRKAIDLQDEVELLLADIDEAVRTHEVDGLLPNVERYLKLKPGHERIRKLQARLKSYSAGQSYRFSDKGDLLEYRPNNSWIWKTALGIALLTAIVYWGVTTLSSRFGSDAEVVGDLPVPTAVVDDEKPPDGESPGDNAGPTIVVDREPGSEQIDLPPSPFDDTWLNFTWLQQRLDETDIDLLMDEFANAPDDADVQTIGAALDLSRAALRTDKDRLWIELKSRTISADSRRINAMLAEPPAGTYLVPRTPTCVQAGEDPSFVQPPFLGYTSCLDVSADGRTAISGLNDQTLKVWDPQSGEELRELKGHSDWIEDVAVSADGRLAVSAGRDDMMMVWDVTGGRVLPSFDAPSDWGLCVAISDDGLTAVSGSRNSTLKVWDLAAGNELRTLEGHSDCVQCVAVTPDGRTAVTGSMDKSIRVWDLATGGEVNELNGHSDEIWSVDISADGKTAVSSSRDGTLKVWDLTTGVETHTITADSSWATSVALTADGRTAISNGWGKLLKMWDTVTGQEARTLPGHLNVGPNCVAVTPDGRLAVSLGGSSNEIKVWDVSSGSERHELLIHDDHVQSVAISADGRTAVSANRNTTLSVWDVATTKEEHLLRGHTHWAFAVGMLADGRTAISGSSDNTLKIWDLTTGSELRTLRETPYMVSSVAVTPDGRTAISASVDSTLSVWDVSSGTIRKTLRGHTNRVWCVAVSADGRTAVSGGFDNTVRIWDVESGRNRRTLPGHTQFISSVAITSDGQTAVSASHDGTVKVWDVDAGSELRTIDDTIGGVASLTTDGRAVIAPSAEHIGLGVWELATGRLLNQVAPTLHRYSRFHSYSAIAVAGSEVVAGTLDGDVHFYRLVGGTDGGNRAAVIPPPSSETPLTGEPVRNETAGLAIAPFGTDEAHRYQQEWASRLGLPVEYTDDLGVEFQLIPPGEFRMGITPEQVDTIAQFDPSFNRELAEYEQPQHRVRISQPFYLGKYEVTKGQFAKFIAQTSYKTTAETDGKGGWGWGARPRTGGRAESDGQDRKYNWRSVGFRQDTTYPVLNLSLNDALAFCEWMSKEEGIEYRLPTEAEWEYACRAGTTSLWYHGDNPEGLAQIANVLDATANSHRILQYVFIDARDGYTYTSPVGSFRPNAFGLYDMHGNAWEWCGYMSRSEYANRGSVTVDPIDTGGLAARRGGSYAHPIWGTYSASRHFLAPALQLYLQGFRLVRTASRGERSTNVLPLEDGFTWLFDGADTSAWNASGNREAVVRDGSLVVDRGTLTTERSFGEAVVRMQFLANDATQAEIKLGGYYTITTHHAGPNHGLSVQGRAPGGNGFVFVNYKPGEWNDLELTVSRGRLTVTLNGESPRFVTLPATVRPAPISVRAEEGPFEIRHVRVQ